MIITHTHAPLSLAEETRLVSLAKTGDRRAMDRLLGAHYKKMFHLALKVTRDPHRAQDVTQEACVQVLRRIDQFRAESRFSAWLSRIVVNTALLRHRRDKRLVPTAEIFSPLAAAPEPGPDRLASDRQLVAKTEAFLGSLREGDRELFLRRFVDGQSLQSLSKETGLSLPALKSRFHRARLRIKDVQERMSWGSVVMA